MPVLIVGAACDTGRSLAALLRAQDAQVRVYVEEDDETFRRAGCKVAIGELDDIGRIESAMEQVHTVVHLAGGADPPRGRTLEWFVEESVEVAVRAAVSADVVRFLTVSDLGAEASSSNAYLATRGRADDLVANSGLQHAVLRCAPILGPASPLGVALRAAAGRRVPLAPAPGTQRCNPVWAGDVAHALLAADAREAAVSGAWEIGGPEVASFDDVIRMATGKSKIAHRRSVPGVPELLARAWRVDRVADAEPFSREVGALPETRLEHAIAATIGSPGDALEKNLLAD